MTPETTTAGIAIAATVIVLLTSALIAPFIARFPFRTYNGAKFQFLQRAALIDAAIVVSFALGAVFGVLL